MECGSSFMPPYVNSKLSLASCFCLVSKQLFYCYDVIMLVLLLCFHKNNVLFVLFLIEL